MICMVVCYEDTHDYVHRDISGIQEFTDRGRRNPGIDKNTVKFISKVIAISAAAAAQTAKKQIHKNFTE